jgi:hypothetical protein
VAEAKTVSATRPSRASAPLPEPSRRRAVPPPAPSP